MAVLLWSVLQSRQALFVRYGPAAFVIDFLLNVTAILLAITLYSSHSILLNVSLIFPALLLYFLFPAATHKKTLSRSNIKVAERDSDFLPVRPFITSYRGTMMVVTCLAILAVDFKIFPRRFAKAENWGTSLMDLGVGSFVFSSGIVSVRPILKDRLAGKKVSLGSRLYASVKHSLPLLVLGFVRLYSVKGLDYAEHTTEYGVHWNFFFTLALLPPWVAIFQFLNSLVPSTALLALVLSSFYQALLEYTSLKAYILTAPRVDLLSMNREGVFSFLGYLAIFLAGQSAGFNILPRNLAGAHHHVDPITQRKQLLGRLIFWSGGWSILYFLATSYNYGFHLRVSRRLANLPYVLWVSAFNCAQITCFCIVESLVFPAVYMATNRSLERKECNRATSTVLMAFNRNGLAIFLLANLLTGLVNMTLDTLSMGREGAMSILVAYAGVLTSIAVTLDYLDLSIKL